MERSTHWHPALGPLHNCRGSERARLEVQLKPKLERPRITGARDLSEVVRVQSHTARLSGRNARRHRGKLRVVEEVETFEAKLGPHLLPDVRVLENGEIPIVDSRPAQGVPPKVPNGPVKRPREGRIIEP